MQFTVISTYENQAEGDAADLGVAAIPTKDGSDDNATIAYANAVLLLSEEEAKREASKAFIRFLLEPENYGRFLNMEPGLFMPLTASGADADSFWNDPMAQEYKEQIETIIANGQNGKLFGFTSGRVFPAIAPISGQNVLAETLQSVVVSDMDTSEAVSAGQARMEDLSR